MSDKNLDTKYREWFDLAWNGYGIPNLKLVFETGYELAKKEMEARLKEAEEVIRELELNFSGYRVADKYWEKWK